MVSIVQLLSVVVLVYIKDSKKVPEQRSKGLYQEFIPGFDMTTPILYNPLTNHLEVLPSVAYYPFSRSVDWYLGEDEKRKHAGYEKVVVKTDENTKRHFLSYISSLSIKTFCRIDARVMCKADHEMIEKLHNQISFHDVFFLEINPTPTIKKGINFHTSLMRD